MQFLLLINKYLENGFALKLTDENEDELVISKNKLIELINTQVN